MTFVLYLINKGLIRRQNKMTADTLQKTTWIIKNEEEEETTGADEETEPGLDKEEEDITGDLELNDEFDEVKENGLDQDEEDKVDDFFEVEK